VSESHDTPATLDITVLRAADLIAADRSGTSDPYVSIHVGKSSKVVGKTHAINKTLHPVWDQKFEVPLTAAQRLENLVLECMDYDAIGSDDHLGNVEIELSSIIPGKEYAGWYPLIAPGGHSAVQDAGRLELRYRLDEEALASEKTFLIDIETEPDGHNAGRSYQFRVHDSEVAAQWLSVLRSASKACKDKNDYLTPAQKLQKAARKLHDSDKFQQIFGAIIMISFVVSLIRTEMVPAEGSEADEVFEGASSWGWGWGWGWH
jgi:hypothetical protein